MANDLYNMSDEEFDQYIPTDEKEHYDRYGLGGWDKESDYTNNNFQPLYFGDGTFMVRKDPDSAYNNRSKDLASKRNNRYNAKQNDGSDEYQYENPYLHDIVNTEIKPRGNWGFKGDGNLEKNQLNPRAIKQKHELKSKDNSTVVDKAKSSRMLSEEQLTKLVTTMVNETLRRVMSESIFRKKSSDTSKNGYAYASRLEKQKEQLRGYVESSIGNTNVSEIKRELLKYIEMANNYSNYKPKTKQDVEKYSFVVAMAKFAKSLARQYDIPISSDYDYDE